MGVVGRLAWLIVEGCESERWLVVGCGGHARFLLSLVGNSCFEAFGLISLEDEFDDSDYESDNSYIHDDLYLDDLPPFVRIPKISHTYGFNTDDDSYIASEDDDDDPQVTALATNTSLCNIHIPN